ncbi:hypothetical protein [Dyadobacter frigoris]|nr:hypothetical protein [Dyadobacter frigoris]GLU53272.1 hypothetical protein Dfri01_27330 [Dyadobacter frigoris]
MILENTQTKYERHFEVMRDLRKGGLNPDMYPEFLNTVKNLPNLPSRKISDYRIFDKFNLSNLTESDVFVISNEFQRRSRNITKTCWHPLASSSTCKVDRSRKIIVTEAHSIQNNGVLSKISENGHVVGFSLDKNGFEDKEIGKNIASTFLGFCNNHDAIFYPIETNSYSGTDEQHFLYAYRAFVVSFHKKRETSYFINYGIQSENDIEENKKIFDLAIISKNYSVIKTDVFELPAHYPMAVSSAANLEFDFDGNPIIHSENRMGNLYI